MEALAIVFLVLAACFAAVGMVLGGDERGNIAVGLLLAGTMISGIALAIWVLV